MEQAAKLRVKVKLHAAQPVVLPSKASPARLSKLKVFLGLSLLVLLSGGGYLLWQQWTGPVPQTIADANGNPSDAAEPAASSTVVVSGNVPPQPTGSAAQPASMAMVESDNAAATVTPDAVINEDQQLAVKPQTIAQTAAAQVSSADSLQTTSSVQAGQNQLEPSAIRNTEPQATTAVASQSLPEGFSRIVLAASMERLEPGAAIDTLVAQQQIQRLYLFTELKGYAGQQLIHRWSYAGKVQTEALLTIEDSPWRTYSEKWLLPDQLGAWRVEIIDQQQQVLYQQDFQYQ